MKRGPLHSDDQGFAPDQVARDALHEAFEDYDAAFAAASANARREIQWNRRTPSVKDVFASGTGDRAAVELSPADALLGAVEEILIEDNNIGIEMLRDNDGKIFAWFLQSL